MIEAEITSSIVTPLQFAVAQKAHLMQGIVMTPLAPFTSVIMYLIFRNASISLCCINKLSQNFVAYSNNCLFAHNSVGWQFGLGQTGPSSACLARAQSCSSCIWQLNWNWMGKDDSLCVWWLVS